MTITIGEPVTEEEYAKLIAAHRKQKGQVPTGTEKVYGQDSEEDVAPKAGTTLERRRQRAAEAGARTDARIAESKRRAAEAKAQLERGFGRPDPELQAQLTGEGIGEPANLTDDEWEQVKAAYKTPGKIDKLYYGARDMGGLVENAGEFLVRAALAASGTETWDSAGALARGNEFERQKENNMALALRPELHDGYVTGGNILGAVADPTSVLALAPAAMTKLLGGRAVAAAAATGAGLGGADAFFYQAKDQEEIDWGAVAGAAALGAGIGAVLKVGGDAIARKYTKRMAEKSEAGLPATIEDAQLLIEDMRNQGRPIIYGQGPDVPRLDDLVDGTARRMDEPRLGMETNRIGFDDVIEGEEFVPNARPTKEAVGVEGNRIEGGNVIEGEFHVIKEGADQLRHDMAQAMIEGNAPRLLGLMRRANPFPIADNIEKRLVDGSYEDAANLVTDSEVEYLRRQYGIPEHIEKNLPPAVAKWDRLPNGRGYEFSDGNALYTISKGAKRSSKWELYQSSGKGKGKRVGQYKTLQGAKRGAQGRIDGPYRIEIEWPTDTKSVVKLRDTKTGKLVEEDFINRRAALQRRDELTKEFEETEKIRLAELREARKRRQMNSQRGFVLADNQAMHAVVGGGAGWLLSDGDVDWALIGALGGAAASKIIRTLKEHPRDSLTQAQVNAKVFAAYWFRKPLNVMRDTFGELGEKFVDQLKFARNDNDAWLAKADRWLRNAELQAQARGYTDETIEQARKEAMRIMRGIDTQGTNKLANAMVRDWRKMLDKTLDDAYEAGIYDRERYLRLKKRANEEGYFPRVYDEVLLNSDEGEKAWIAAWDGKEMSAPKAQRLLNAIVGNKELEAKLLKGARRNKDKIVFDENLARLMLEVRRSKHVGSRSNHLDKARKLPTELEELLEPFLVKEPLEALSRYLLDAGNRINHAKRFGANDEKAMAIFEAINKQYGGSASKLAQEVYYARVGDMQAKNIADAVNMNDTMRKIQGRVDAFETLKLSMAQITNSGQVPINGSVLAAKLTGGNPKQMMKMWIDMAEDIKSGKLSAEDTRRMGANIEATMSQLMGEAGASHYRILGKKFDDIHTKGGKIYVNPMEYINNPTQFLKKSGFLRVEDFNRALASNMGRGIGQQLIDEMNTIRAAGDKPSKRLVDSMKELGLNPNAKDWGMADLDRAGLRFSDAVNFRNSPGELPLAWEHPQAKFFRKFKSFAFNHASFLMDSVIRPLYNKNIKGGAGAASAYAVMSGVMGMPVDEVKRMIKGDDRDLTGTERYMRAVTAAGGLGIWSDLLRSHDPLSAFAGPAASDANKLFKEVKQTAAGSQGPAKMISDLARGTLVLPREKQMYGAINDVLNLE